MSSKVHIFNIALGRIGKQSVNNPDDLANPSARYCSQFWDQCLNEVLQAANWDFAKKQVALASLGNPPPNWAFRYQLPSDCVKAREIVKSSRTAKPIPFEKMAADDGNSVHVLTDKDDAWLSYTGRIVNPSVFPPSFISALSWRLAAEISWPLTKDKNLSERCIDNYRIAVSHASSVDAQESVQDEPRDADWIAARS